MYFKVYIVYPNNMKIYLSFRSNLWNIWRTFSIDNESTSKYYETQTTNEPVKYPNEHVKKVKKVIPSMSKIRERHSFKCWSKG